MHRTIARLGTVTAALAALSACGAPQADRAPQDRMTAGAAGLDRLTDAEEARLAWAEQLLMQRCMKREGLKYWPGRPADPDELKNTTLFLDDVRWAREHGYGSEFERKADRERRKDPNSAYLAGLSKREHTRWDRAFFGGGNGRTVSVTLPSGGRAGVSLDGCVAQARDTLYGDLAQWFRASKTAENLAPLYAKDLKNDPRFKGAVRTWSRCMRGKGHDYATPAAIRNRLPELTERLAPDRAHDAEVRLAVAEAQCARSSGLGDTARRLEQEYRDKTIGTRYRDEVDTHLRLQHRALTKARAVTKGRG
ncbi:hypothetical protein [Streptomyces boninensis]|uniref:hypothetical protein n=1 Tax=Streptomyces boninensis TaxID=2039455 RepID=UPI003B224C59